MAEEFFLIGLAKRIIITFGFRLGVFKIFKFVCSKKEYVPILLYHRVMDSLNTRTGISAFYIRGLAVSKSDFEKQINYLVRNYEVISLKQYLEKKKGKESLRGFAVITFDDGFKDFKEISLNILKNNNCPATVFAIAENEARNFWRAELYAILDFAKNIEHEWLAQDGRRIAVSFKNKKQKQASLHLLLDYLDKLSHQDRDKELVRLKEELGICEKDIFDNLFLKQDDLKTLVNTGIYIGAHSLSHRDLTLLDEGELKKEIGESIDYIKTINPNQEVCFSVPFGKINKNIIENLRLNRISAVVIGEGGLNSKDEDIFRLKRLFIQEGDLAQFAYQVSGAQMFFNKFISKPNIQSREDE